MSETALPPFVPEQPFPEAPSPALFPLFDIPSDDAPRRDAAVEEALFLLATGYREVTVKPVRLRRAEYDGGKKVAETEEVVLQEEETLAPPNVTAIRYWLACRCPGRWGDAAADGSQEESLGRLDALLAAVSASSPAEDAAREDSPAAES